MLPDEYKHSQNDDLTSGTSGPNPGVAAPTPEPSYTFWAHPESVSLEHGFSPYGSGYNPPGVLPFPPFPAFPTQFPFFGRHHHGGPPPPPPPPPPGPPGEHPDPPLPPPPPPALAQDPLGSFGPWRDYLDNIASWTQQAVNAYSGVGDHAHGHGHHGHHGHHVSHFGPRRGGRRGHHHESGSEGEGPGHRGPGGPWGSRRGGWGSHRGRGGRCGHHGPPHHGFIHPAMDIISSDDAYTVTIELPGLRKDDVEISVHGRVLTVSGEFKPGTGAPTPPAPSEGYPIEYTEDEEDPFIDVDDNIEKKRKDSAILKERRVGKFKRSIDLPSWVDAEKGIKASMADGILTIIFNKAPESKAKKVNIL